VDKLAGALLTISLLSLGVNLIMGIHMPSVLMAELYDRLARFVFRSGRSIPQKRRTKESTVPNNGSALALSHLHEKDGFADVADCLMRSRPWRQPVSPLKILYTAPIRAR
jgi:hypothetical protein